MNNKLIYIVDDEEDILELFKGNFDETLFTVECFSNTKDFNEKFQHKAPDLVITDLVINGDDGLTIIEKVNAEGPEIPIFVMSGFLTKDRLDKLKGLNTVSINSKPFKMLPYIKEIENYLVQDH